MNTHTAIIPPKGGNEHSAGAKTHEFTSPDVECAQALCDAMDWIYKGELLGTVEDPDQGESWKEPTPQEKKIPTKKRQSAGDQRKRKPSSYVGNKLLNKGQKATLCQLAKSAFDHLDSYGLIEGVDESLSASKQLEQWRRNLVKEITGKDSLTVCHNSDYRSIEAELLKLGGQKYNNPQAYATGRQSEPKATEKREDTMENREQALWLIETEIKKHAEKMESLGHGEFIINQGYILSIARNQNKTTKITDFDALLVLDADTLFRLLYTTKNRITARERKYGCES